MKRREFITLLGSTVAAWPFAVRAQQPERVRRIGVLMALSANDAEGQARVAAFLQGLQELGWSVGRNVIVDIRWSAGNNADTRKYGGIGRTRAGCHPGKRQRGCCAIGRDDPHRSDSVYDCRRSSWCWLCREPGTAGR